MIKTECILRPDITAMVDWALKINYLSIWMHSVFVKLICDTDNDSK